LKRATVKRFLLWIWSILPDWLESIASAIVRPHFNVVVIAIVMNAQGQLLLCKHTYRRKYPWGMPGGDIHVNEDPAEAVRRELREETGFSAQEVRLILVEGSQIMRKVMLTYACTGIRGSFTPNEEISMIQYFDTNQLPTLHEEHRATVEKALAILKSEQE
jgi:8-oxo-dGTP diphosphatase